MIKIVAIFFVFITAVNHRLFSQINLVQNGDFETMVACPTNDGQIYNAQGWINPTQSTPDYFHTCSTANFNIVNVPNNGFGTQNSKSGLAYSGIYAGSYNCLPIDCREYIQTQLTSPLIIAHQYYVEFFVSLAEIGQMATSRMGAAFSTFAPSSGGMGPILGTPQVENSLGNFLTDYSNWTKISGSFISSGGEQWITIGNFYDNNNTDTLSLPFTGVQVKTFYYYIDDVTLIDQATVGLNELEKTNSIEIYPNPVNDILNITSDKIVDNSYLNIFNLLG